MQRQHISLGRQWRGVLISAVASCCIACGDAKHTFVPLFKKTSSFKIFFQDIFFSVFIVKMAQNYV